MTTRDKLVSAVIQYDAKQRNKRNYNIFALPQYISRVEDIMQDIEAGANDRDAIVAAFTGTLLTHVLRSLKLEKATDDEIKGAGGILYRPVANKN